jgi:hypothetical protein
MRKGGRENGREVLVSWQPHTSKDGSERGAYGWIIVIP